MLRADPSGDMPFVENLWSFALATYQKPDVARLCLHWQDDYGADINLLLTAAWLASEQKVWTVDVVTALERHCADWRRFGLLPLRVVRRALVNTGRGTELYSAAKLLELEAERLQLVMIERWLVQSALPAGNLPPPACLAVNFGAYVHSIPLGEVPVAEAVRELITALK